MSLYIVKNGKEFTIEEKKNHWNVYRIEGTSGVCLKIYKTACPTIEDVVKRVRPRGYFSGADRKRSGRSVFEKIKSSQCGRG